MNRNMNRRLSALNFSSRSSTSLSPLLFTSLRFCSSSSPSSSATDAAISDIQRVLSSRWSALPEVAGQPSDDTLDAVSEFGGLRQFVQENKDACTICEVRRTEAGAFQLRLKTPAATATSSSNDDTAISFDNLPLPPPPPLPEAKSLRQQKYQEQQQQQQQRLQGLPRAPAQDAFDAMMKADMQRAKEREILRGVPAHAVPLTQVAEFRLGQQEKDGDADGGGHDYELDVHLCREMLEVLKPMKDLLLLLAPVSDSKHDEIFWASTPVDQLSDEQKFVYRHTMISLSPVYLSTHLDRDADRHYAGIKNEDNDDKQQQQQRDETAAAPQNIANSVPEWDSCRLARHLSTESFTTVRSIVDSNVSTILQKDVLHVIAAYPLLFEYIPPGTPLPDGAVVGTVVQICAANAEQGCPRLHVIAACDVVVVEGEKKESKDEEEPPVAAEKSKEQQGPDLGVVRFILHETEFNNGLGGIPAWVEQLDQAKLDAVYKSLLNRKITPEDATKLATEMNLPIKKIPRGLGRVRLKHSVIRCLIKRRFSRGNPFFDRSVFAHHIFDTLPETDAISLLDYRDQFLPESGRTCAPLSAKFVQSYPHLFDVRQVEDASNDWVLQRADLSPLPKQKKVEDITAEEIVKTLFLRRPKSWTRETATGDSSLMALLPMAHQNRVRQLGGMKHLVREFPDNFEVVSDCNANFSVRWLKNPSVESV